MQATPQMSNSRNASIPGHEFRLNESKEFFNAQPKQLTRSITSNASPDKHEIPEGHVTLHHGHWCALTVVTQHVQRLVHAQR